MKATAQAATTLERPEPKSVPKKGRLLKSHPNQLDMFSLEAMADDFLAAADAAEAAKKLQESTTLAIAAAPALAAELTPDGRSNLDFARFMRSADMPAAEVESALVAIGAQPTVVMKHVAQVEEALDDSGDFSDENPLDSDFSSPSDVDEDESADKAVMTAGDSRGADSTSLFLATLRGKRFDPATHEQMAALATLIQAGEAANKQYLVRGPAAPKLHATLMASIQAGANAAAELVRLQTELKESIEAAVAANAVLVETGKLDANAAAQSNTEFAKNAKVDPDRQEHLEGLVRESELARDNIAARDATSEEISAWQAPMRAGHRAREELINRNMRFMVTMARRHLKTGRPFDDLIQAGSEGLMEAAVRFDPVKGKFTTIATWWILQKIQRSVQADANMPIPSYLPGQEAKLLRMAEAASTPEAKAHLVAKAEKAAKRLESRRRNAVSLDSSRGGDEDDGANMLSMLEAENPSQEERLERLQLVKKLVECAGSLPERDRDMFLMRIGLHPDHPGDSCTLAEIADHFAVTVEGVRKTVSRERVRQIYVQSAGKVADMMEKWAKEDDNLPDGFRKGLMNPGKS